MALACLESYFFLLVYRSTGHRSKLCSLLMQRNKDYHTRVAILSYVSFVPVLL